MEKISDTFLLPFTLVKEKGSIYFYGAKFLLHFTLVKAKLLYTFMEPTFCCSLLWLKQKLLITFMDPKVKYMCINWPHTSNYPLFHLCLNHKFVQISTLSKSDSCLYLNLV